MEEALHRSFGYVIAFILPGLVAIHALSVVCPELTVLGNATGTAELSVSGWIAVLLESLGVGLVVSAARWILIDTLHHRTGLAAPRFDFGRLHNQLDVFLVAVEHNYRFYQWYSNLFISILLVVTIHFLQPVTAWSWHTYLGLAGLELLLLVASRDCLRRYYSRLDQLVGKPPPTMPAADS